MLGHPRIPVVSENSVEAILAMNTVREAGMLEHLGETADEVALALKANGIRGVRNTVRFLNPIVRFIQIQEEDDSLQIDVMMGNTLRIAYPDGRQEETPLPAAVKDFLDRFNRGAYLDLELRTGFKRS